MVTNSYFFLILSAFCGVNLDLEELSGVITSPNFPNNYDANENCLWTIKAPPGYRVQFAIHFLGIELRRYSRPGTVCMDDSIQVSELRENSTRDVVLLCGCGRLFSFVSYERKVFVKFTSFRKNNWPGFYSTYQTLGKFLVSKEGHNSNIIKPDIIRHKHLYILSSKLLECKLKWGRLLCTVMSSYFSDFSRSFAESKSIG